MSSPKSTRLPLWGVIAVPITLLVSLLWIAQYCDCYSKFQTYEWIRKVKPTLNTISVYAINQKSLLTAGRGVKLPDTQAFLGEMQMEIAKSGTVFMWGGDDGQLAVLIPRLADGKVVWRCVGGSRKATPSVSCEAMNYSPTPEDFAKQ